MSYRPITDTWILARSKVKFYGAYPAGFLHRARALLGVGPDDAVLHVCAGRVREYPYRGFGSNDMTLDLDPALKPDFLRDARESFPVMVKPEKDRPWAGKPWAAILADPPYTDADADKYTPGAAVRPTGTIILTRAFEPGVLREGGRVGILDYQWPRPPRQNVREVAVIAVGTGRNGRARWFTVWEEVK